MGRIIDVLPIILLGIGQVMQGTIIMYHTIRIRELEEEIMAMDCQREVLREVRNGEQE